MSFKCYHLLSKHSLYIKKAANRNILFHCFKIVKFKKAEEDDLNKLRWSIPKRGNLLLSFSSFHIFLDPYIYLRFCECKFFLVMTNYKISSFDFFFQNDKKQVNFLRPIHDFRSSNKGSLRNQTITVLLKLKKGLFEIL